VVPVRFGGVGGGLPTLGWGGGGPDGGAQAPAEGPRGGSGRAQARRGRPDRGVRTAQAGRAARARKCRPGPREHRAHPPFTRGVGPDPTVEQGPGGPAQRRSRRVTVAKVGERKARREAGRGERVVFGRRGDAARATGGDQGFAGLEWHREEARFATGGNAMNPRIGSGMQQARRVEEEQTVEVVQDHEDGTRARCGNRAPTVGQQCPTRSGLPGLNDGGAIFGQPQERKPGRHAGRQGPDRCRKRRREGRQGTLAHLNHERAPGRWSLRTSAARERGVNVARDGGKPTFHDIDRFVLPPRRPSAMCTRRRDPPGGACGRLRKQPLR